MLTRILLAWVACAIAAGAASANTWPLYSQQRGQVGYEVEGLPQTAILHETLRIDLTGAPAGGDAQVEVDYQLRHEGEAIEAQLVFVPDTVETTRIAITFNGDPIAVGESMPFESRWDLPGTMPGLLDRTHLIGAHSRTSPLAGHSFAITLTEGEHELSVEYAVATGSVSFPRDPVEYHQLLYALAPARAWKSFGGIEIDVLVPSSWHVASNPELRRNGQHLGGDFDALPADFLTLTFVAPNNYGTLSAANHFLGGGTFVLLLFCLIFLCNKRYLLALAMPAGAIALRLLGAWLVPVLADDPDAISPAFLYGMRDPLYLGLQVVMYGVPAGVVVGIGWLIVRRRARAREKNATP